jgi:hypothetical protein
MDDRDRIDEREQNHEQKEDAPNPEDRLDEREAVLGAPPPLSAADEINRRRKDKDDSDDGPVAA